jgi:hypothetical protein
MSYFIAAENPGMSQSEARRRSEQMMMGHKMEYFILNLSFIGWIFLSIFTFGIGMFFVMPYMYTASAAFYDNLKLGQFVGGGSNGGSNGASNWNDDGSFSGPTGGSRFGRQSDSYDGGSSNNVFDNVFGSSKSNGNDDDDYTIG